MTRDEMVVVISKIWAEMEVESMAKDFPEMRPELREALIDSTELLLVESCETVTALVDQFLAERF